MELTRYDPAEGPVRVIPADEDALLDLFDRSWGPWEMDDRRPAVMVFMGTAVWIAKQYDLTTWRTRFFYVPREDKFFMQHWAPMQDSPWGLHGSVLYPASEARLHDRQQWDKDLWDITKGMIEKMGAWRLAHYGPQRREEELDETSRNTGP